jgi:DNA segregation ATPase FtsK/SpoIIIE-like protein
LQQISRQVRAANGRLVVVTQRPDAEDAIPGAVRDMLEDRIILGFVSGTGARMVLEKDWQAVTDEYGQAPVPGRGLARITGRLVRIQGFRLDPPREHPELEQFYPPRLRSEPARHDPTGAADEQTERRRSGTLPTATTRWAPAPPATPPTDTTARDAVVGIDDAHTPPYGVPTTSPAPPSPPMRDGPPLGQQRPGTV